MPRNFHLPARSGTGFTSPLAGEVGPRSGPGGAVRLAPAELEALLFLLLGGRRTGDHLSQLLHPACDRALGVGQDEDLALDRGLIGLGPVEVYLDRELLLERA